VSPTEWFLRTAAQGVLWLNTALTFAPGVCGVAGGSTHLLACVAYGRSRWQSDLATHTAFWRPIVERIIEVLLATKKESPVGSPPGLVFVMWGTHAQKLKKVVGPRSPPLRHTLV